MFRIVPKTKKKTHKKDNSKIWNQFNNMMETDNIKCISKYISLKIFDQPDIHIDL